VVGGVQSIILVLLYSSGALQQSLGSQQSALESVNAVIQALISTPFHLFIMGAFERVPALLLHIALSIVVLRGVRERRFHYVLYAIGLHALVDFFPALYQTKALSIYAVEAIVLVAGAACFVYLRHARKAYGSEWNRTPEQ
jgi:uncharacterized membrane protein YhfC